MSQPKILFVQGVADDGKIGLTAETRPEEISSITSKQFQIYNNATMIRRFIPGSLNFFDYLKPEGFKKEVFLIVGERHQTFKFEIPDMIFNCIVEPDVSHNALVKLQNVINTIRNERKINIPIFNMPKNIFKTTRTNIYNQFKGLPGIDIPRAISITPKSVAETIKMIKIEKIKLPFLIREVGAHGGRGMKLIKSWDANELLKLETFPYDGRSFYVTEWQDFASVDGFYRKSRIAVIDGKYVPRHRLIADTWNLHADVRNNHMLDNKSFRTEEETFVTSPFFNNLSPTTIDSLKKLNQELDLDYYGIDCCVKPDGTLLIFEINCAFHTLHQSDPDKFTYLLYPLERVRQTLEAAIIDKFNA